MKPPVEVIASAMRYTHQPSSDAAHIVKALESAGYVIVLKAPSLDLAGSTTTRTVWPPSTHLPGGGS